MNYYKVEIIGKNIDSLTYKSPKLLEVGSVVDITLRGRGLKGVVIKECKMPKYEVLEASPTGEYIDSLSLKTAEFIASYYVCRLSIALSLFYPKVYNQKTPKPIEIETKNPLTQAQKEALLFIDTHQVSLLFGDTGSGKSEIYFELIARLLKEGKTAIILMPEISLTPQMEHRLKDNFGDIVALWHSKVTKKRKEETLKGIYEDRIKIVAGARSALFLPLLNIGAIIVDEEHEGSFKSQSSPRINARDLSVYYGLKIGAKVVLGSATPSLKSFVKYPHFRLKGRHFKSHKRLYFDEGEDITPYIADSISKKLAKKEQILVFNPTRGDFKYLFCPSCISSIKCPYCDVSMSLHRYQNAIKCHYCGYTSPVPKSCPNCNSNELITLRAGTNNLKERLEEIFPEATIEKFDRDSIKSESRLKTILKRFNEGEIDILVGTQMLSKGHDYHNVSLSIVLGIDYLLNGSEYASRERALALALQVAGRSGRRFGGDVIVQSRNREFFEEYLGDFEKFLNSEKRYREGLYPPFVRMALVRFEEKDEKRAKENMQKALSLLKNAQNIEIVGAKESPIKKIANRYRFMIVLRSQDAGALNRALWSLKGVKCDIDVDPESFI